MLSGAAAPDVVPDAVVTVATVDKKGIVIRKSHEDEAFPVDPDKPGKKKMATVFSTYMTPLHIRTEDDIVGEVLGQRGSNSKPKPQNKMTWVSLTEGSEKTMARLRKAVDQRLPRRNEPVCIPEERDFSGHWYTHERLGKAALCY